MKKEIQATVQSVDLHGQWGPYATATARGVKGTITFSLDGNVWHEHSIPERGSFVMLSELQKKRKGWRAMSARLFSPADEALSAMQQKGEVGS